MTKLLAKDCSPFFESKNQHALKQDAEKALKSFLNFFHKAYPKSLEEDCVVQLKPSIISYPTPQDERKAQTLWWAGRYIGIANIKEGSKIYEISIRPRFGEHFLLMVLSDVYNIKTFEHDGVATDSKSNDWFGSLLYVLQRKMWIEKCTHANRFGLPRKTIKQMHQGLTLQGTIDIRRTMHSWMLNKEMVTSTYEKVLDEHICKIVYEAHRILSKSVKGKTKQEKKQITALSTSIPPLVQETIHALDNEYKGTLFTLTENDYKRIRYKSIYASWKPLVDFSWSVIRNRNLSMKSADAISDCVFVDMAEIWEAFLRKKLGEGLHNEGWRVWSGEECEQKVYKSGFFGRKIIPDIVLQRNVDGKEQFLIFDAKYKRMTGNKLDVDRTDFFQIHTYIHYFQHTYPDGEVLLGGLLYPLTKNSNQEEVNIDEVTGAHALFGREDGLFNTKFIVDGIVCPESNEEFDKDSIDSNIENLIERIKDNIQ